MGITGVGGAGEMCPGVYYTPFPRCAVRGFAAKPQAAGRGCRTCPALQQYPQRATTDPSRGCPMPNSFGSLSTLSRRREGVHHPPPRRRRAGPPAGQEAAVLAQDPARKPAPQRERPVRPQGRHRGPGQVGPEGRAEHRDRLHPGPRAAAGLHRRAVRRRPRRHARRHEGASAATRRRSTRSSRSNWSSTTRCRWTTSAPPQAFADNTQLEYERNQERYTFLRWGQNAFRNFKVVPPETGIVHQVNLEYLARVRVRRRARARPTRTRSSAPTRTPR